MKNIQVHVSRLAAFVKKNPLVVVALVVLASAATMAPVSVGN